MSVLPVIHVKGTHYQVGYQIGSSMRHHIQDYVECLPLLQEVLLPFSESEEGIKAYKNAETLLRQKVPQYVEEVEGIAAGAKVPFKSVFLLNMNCPKGVTEKGCSTIIIPRPGGQGPIFGHTEDGPPESAGRIFMVHVEIPASEDMEGENFTALCYPGSLPGRCFGFTSAGFAWSMNSTSPKMERTGIPIQFLSRTLAGQGPSGLSKLLTSLGNGGSLNMVDATTALNLEVAPFRYGIKMLEEKAMFHCNMYTHLAVKQKEDIHWESSIARLARMGEERMESEEDMKRCLGDTQGDLQIFRTEDRERDVLVTVATGIFDMSEGRLDVYVSNPATSDPIYSCRFQPKKVLQDWDLLVTL